MKPQIRRRRQSPASSAAFRLGIPWKLGFVVVAAALLMARGASQAPPIHLHQQSLAAGGGPTTVACGDLPAGVTTWSAAGSPYILPSTIPDPNEPACPAFPVAGQDEPPVAPGVVVRANSTLVIDGSQGPVEIFSHGAGIDVMGGELQTIGTGPSNSVTFDAEPDVASWDGIRILADGGRKGDASLSYVSIQHALTGINITSGATASPDDNHYGLTVRNSGIVVSYFDGIDAVNTPISITGLGDGRFGTLNNIGSFGIRVSFDAHAPSIPENALDVRSMTFGSSVPFAETGCPPLQPCAAGTIGNDAIQATFVDHARQPALISHNKIFRAGSYGIELANPSDPIVQDNIFDCNGTGSSQPKVSCLSNVPNKFPPIYLSNATADLESKVTSNFGQEDGLEAIAFNGTVSSGTFTWRTATTNPARPLGYVLNGSLNMSGGVFRVPGGSVLKASGGSLNLSEVTLDASDTGSKTFTSLRDRTAGIDAGCSVFVQVCSPPLPLPAGDWGGIKLVGAGANATIDHANVRYATVAITIANGAMSSPSAAAPTAITAPAADGPGFGLVVSNSAIGPTFADGIVALDTPIALLANIFTCPTTSCSGSSPIGNRGVDADFGGVGPLNGGLKLAGNHFDGSVNEAIRASALSGQLSGSVLLGPQPVSIRGNIIQAAGAFGISLQGAVRPTLRDNDITGSGTGPVKYSAVYLNGLTAGDFNSPGSVTPPSADPAVIWGNTGKGNGLNAIAFHGTTAGTTSSPRSLNWQTVGASGLLGYIVDGDLSVNGPLTLNAGAYAPILAGTITVSGGGLNANAAIVTSLKAQAPGMRSCGSVFVPRVSGICPAQRAGDWGGFVLDPGQVNTLTATQVRYARTGITMDKPAVTPALTNLVLAQTSISNTTANGITTQSPLSVTQGAFTNLGGQGIAVDLSNAGSGATLTVDGAVMASTGKEGLRASGLGTQVVTVTNNRIDQAGAFGISLSKASILKLANNTVTNGAAGFPAIYLNQVDHANFDAAVPGSRLITGNKGAANGVDALAFDGNVDGDLQWQTARNTTDPTRLLGYILDGDLNMSGTLTVRAGDIVKIRNGTINLNGGHLRADDVANSSKKVFTSLADTTAGVGCPSALVPGCPAAAAGDWGGINLTGGTDATLVNAAVRYASTGIRIDGGPTSTFASSSFGLVVSGTTIGPSLADGIKATNTSISVATSTISGGVHGVNADYTTLPPMAPTPTLRLSGDRFTSTSAEAILGQALGGLPVWIADNRVQAAGTFGIRLVNATDLVLRNNTITGSGNLNGYPAIYLKSVSADFARNVRGNLGGGNGLDALVMDGTVTSDLTWITPSNGSGTHALGYLLDGGLMLDGSTLSVRPGDVVKALGGAITLNGGSLIAGGTGGQAIFTSLKDTSGAAAIAVSCPSIFVSSTDCGHPQAGNWGGISITDKAGTQGNSTLVNSLIDYVETGIAINSGPVASTAPKLTVSGTTILNASKDGINAFDSPIHVDSSFVGDPAAGRSNIQAHGIIASFFSPPNCPPSPTPPGCERLTLTGNHIAWTGKDGIVANGLGDQPTVVSDNVVNNSGTYGIRLVGANQLTVNHNQVDDSGGATTGFRYPAMYLSSVKADFELARGAATVAENHGSGNGFNAIVLHGETTRSMTWLTRGLGVPGVAGDHFGYLLDGGLAVGGALTTNNGDQVKVLGGPITVAGALTSTGTTFTSLNNAAVGISVCDAAFDSAMIQKPTPSAACPPPASGDWAGISVGGAATLTDTTVSFDDGLTVNGPLHYAGGAMRDIEKNAIVVSGSALSVTNVAFSRIGLDAIDSTKSGSTDTVTDNQFDHVGGVSINLHDAPADLARNVFTNDASPAIRTSGAAVTVECSSIQSGGVSGDGSLTVKENDFVPTVGVAAPNTASAENNWWGQAGGPSGQLSGGLTVATYFTTQNPTATISITGKPSITQPLDPVKSNGSLGTGLVEATLTFSRDMNQESTVPDVTYASTPVSFSGTWQSPRAWKGTAPIDSVLAANGSHAVSATGAHDCVPDPLHNLMTPAGPTSFTVDTAGLPNVSVNAPADLIGAGSARLHGRIDPNGWATGAQGHFVVTNSASPFDQHSYATSVPADKVTPVTFTVTATGLNPSSTYTYQLQVPSVNGPATQPTTDSVTTIGAPSKVVVTSSPPASAVAGANFSAAVSVEDASGNVVTDFAGTVSLALTVPNGAALSGGSSRSAVNGVASFTSLSVDKKGSYTLTAASASLTSDVSTSITIQAGTPSQLVFATQPSSAAAPGLAFASQPVVSVEDSLGNVVDTDSTTGVTLGLMGGDSTAALTCTSAPATVTNGVATFAGCSIDKGSPTTYQLTVASTSPTLGPVSSTQVTVS